MQASDFHGWATSVCGWGTKFLTTSSSRELFTWAMSAWCGGTKFLTATLKLFTFHRIILRPLQVSLISQQWVYYINIYEAHLPTLFYFSTEIMNMRVMSQTGRSHVSGWNCIRFTQFVPPMEYLESTRGSYTCPNKPHMNVHAANRCTSTQSHVLNYTTTHYTCTP